MCIGPFVIGAGQDHRIAGLECSQVHHNAVNGQIHFCKYKRVFIPEGFRKRIYPRREIRIADTSGIGFEGGLTPKFSKPVCEATAIEPIIHITSTVISRPQADTFQAGEITTYRRIDAPGSWSGKTQSPGTTCRTGRLGSGPFVASSAYSLKRGSSLSLRSIASAIS